MDADGELLNVLRINGPQNGMLTLNPDGSFTYTPSGAFFGRDSFSYRALDAAGDSGLATVMIDVANTRLWRNGNNPLDVNGDGSVSPVDVLIVVNYINGNGAGPVPESPQAPPPFLDVNGDDMVSPVGDALPIIAFLNESVSGVGEGEGKDGDGGEAPPGVRLVESPTTFSPTRVLRQSLLPAADSGRLAARPESSILHRSAERAAAVDEVDFDALDDGPWRVAVTAPAAADCDRRVDHELEELLDDLVAHIGPHDHDFFFSRWNG
jgi:hypothetical protein